MLEMKMLINGEWVDSSTKERFDSVNPFNQEAWASIPKASEQDINDAIHAAKHAFHKTWKHTNGITRAQMMTKLADLLDQRAEEMGRLETTDNGKVIRETKTQMHFAARNYRFFGAYADKLYGEVIPLDNTNCFDYTLREPIGVVVLITAWNSPMAILANKLAPALAAGNTVVIKPSEHTSVTTLEFGKLIMEAGFPAGVVNIVTGDGKVGDLLTKSSDIDKISFTGGTETGRAIAQNASLNLIPTTMELGGKSPNMIFDDANLERAVNGAIAGIFAAAGQTCIAGSRLLVQDSIYDEIVFKLAEKTKSIRLGDPLKAETQMGPVANKHQMDRILKFIQYGKDEGAELIVGGAPGQTEECKRGYFIEPTIFAGVSNKMTIAQEEIFGPVLSVIPFTNESEAVEIANDIPGGLASGIWTKDLARAHRVGRQIEAGTVWINTYRTNAAQAPFGGVKQSGYGRERGHHALLDYTRVKNVMIDLSEDERDPFSVKV
ncbi:MULTISPECIES: aldehyde dehydrogenase [unclassified Paenibacillus]|uniref:aldehyde dehydrogenase n=1 Tax=unclassified Paenibacillus TaxID=185978 RepID=UPI001AE75EA8|nr:MULTISPECIES: aldehyde dehydrogenase [unclassified Paenibacillus]MBP1155862.1 aldehyde dehydrogenase (NAD+) [Paenibacillus sp. PvP091]MBP1168752.1 aldehyde dehydrogenase (NAD+) [Paenibacillus sp. PvR098]MBP2439780.1 aldehyde dehydrogenase (NAD+) [Paenibacillus sp. PvP052]